MKCEWKTVKLGDIAEFNKFTYSVKDEWKFVNYLDTGNITENRIEAIQYIDLFKESLPSRAKRKVKNCNIIYSTVRPNQLHYGYIKEQPNNFLVSTGFAVIDVNEEFANSQFIYYFLTQNSITDYLHSIAEQSVSAYPSIKSSDLADVEINLPDLETQKKIAKILSSLDDKIELNNAINHNLQQQAHNIFKAKFTNNPNLGSIEKIPLAQLCSVITKGTTPTTLGKQFIKNGINFIKAESILDNHTIDKSKFNFIDEETNILLKRSIIHSGDIVFTIAGTLGRFALVSENIIPANTNQAVAIIRADRSKILPEYLYSCFIGEWHIDYYSKRVQQAVQANLSLSTIKSLPIPLLKNNEMEDYLRIIQPIFETIKANNHQNETLLNLRNTLLPRLMSGEIDVSEVDI